MFSVLFTLLAAFVRRCRGDLMTNEEMLACFVSAAVCVLTADYAKVSFWHGGIGAHDMVQPLAYAQLNTSLDLAVVLLEC